MTKKKRRLFESGLKIKEWKITSGIEVLQALKPNKKRRYPLASEVEGYIKTNQGALFFKARAGFEFDGRSGPKIVDWYVPNLGSIEEIVCWLVHDLNGYGLDLCFKDTNVLLFAMLRDMAKYRYVKAKLVQGAVSVSDSWFGVPKPDDWCFRNIGLVETRFVA